MDNSMVGIRLLQPDILVVSSIYQLQTNFNPKDHISRPGKHYLSDKTRHVETVFVMIAVTVDCGSVVGKISFVFITTSVEGPFDVELIELRVGLV